MLDLIATFEASDTLALALFIDNDELVVVSNDVRFGIDEKIS